MGLTSERDPGVAWPAVCLGCGCACDDIAVAVEGGRIVEARGACARGREWFGDGAVPARILVGGADAALERALDEGASILAGAQQALVYLAAELSCEAQGAGVAIADAIGARLDTLAADAAMEWMLAGQRRGAVTATLGELRARADLFVFWGTDPAVTHPRWRERFLDVAGLHVGARGTRTVIAVDVGDRRGPADADARIVVPAGSEVALLQAVRAALKGRGDAGDDATMLAERLRAGRYVAIVHDAERWGRGAMETARAEGLALLARELNTHTRCALSALRGGGNRAGADGVLLWQTGYPAAVELGRGFPEYRPDRTAADLLGEGLLEAALVLGDAGSLPEPLALRLARVPVVVVGPRASERAPWARVAVDTGVAGIHEGGTAARMDDVPLPLRPALSHPVSAARAARMLGARAGALRAARRDAREA